MRLHTANAYVSTIGGGAFLMKFIGDAVRQALKQVAIARALGDVGLEARCHVHLAYCDVQVGRFRSASRRLRLLHRIAGPRYLDDAVLVRMCDAGLRHARLTCQLWRSGALEMRPESDAAGALLSLQQVEAVGGGAAASAAHIDDSTMGAAAASAGAAAPAASSIGSAAVAHFAASGRVTADGSSAAAGSSVASPAGGAGASADAMRLDSIGAAAAAGASAGDCSSPASMSPRSPAAAGLSPAASGQSPRVSGPGTGAAVIVPTHALASDDYRRIRLAKLDAPRLKENR